LRTQSRYMYMGQNPTYKQVRLTANVSAGATVLPIDTDVTGDLWADGDTIGIDTQCMVGAMKNEDKTIAVGGITSNSITIAAGLTYKKDAGDYVTLMTRHLRMQGGANCWSFKGTTSIVHGAWFSATPGGWLIGSSAMGQGECVYSGGSYGFYISSTGTAKISKGIWRSINNLFQNCTGASLEGGYIGGCSPVFNGGTGHSMSGGIIFGCTYAFSGCATVSVTGGYTYGTWGVFNSCYCVGSGFTLGYSQYQLGTTVFTFYGAVIPNFVNINYQYLNKTFISQWFDYQGVSGAYKAWTAGGVTTKQATIYPTGKTYAMQTVLEKSDIEGYFQKEITVGAGASVNITSHLRKDASMAYLPRVIVFNKATTDPFAGGAGLHTFTMTNSIDTWESDVYTYTNGTSEDVTLVIRAQGMNATGNMYTYLDFEQINVDLTSAIALINAVKAKTDNLPVTPAFAGEYTAAIGAIPTTPLLETEYTAPDNASIAAILEDTGISIPATIAAIPAAPTVAQILTAVADGTLTVQDSLKILNATLAGKLSGGKSGTLSFRNPADTKDRIIATVDLDTGDRTNITMDLT